MSESLTFPEALQAPLAQYLPPTPPVNTADDIYLTLTFATSLDSSLSLAPGVRTRLSGAESKAMTHFLRSRHDAILVGVSTAVADDPGLNCRIAGVERQPRPVVVDPKGRWAFTRESKVFEVGRAGVGLGPWVLVAEGTVVDGEREAILKEHGGKYIHVPVTNQGRLSWPTILSALSTNGIQSLMVEGGAQIINDLLSVENNRLISSVIVTIAPTWLGQGGVVVSPPQTTDAAGGLVPAVRLAAPKWVPFGEDVVLCGRIE